MHLDSHTSGERIEADRPDQSPDDREDRLDILVPRQAGIDSTREHSPVTVASAREANHPTPRSGLSQTTDVPSAPVQRHAIEQDPDYTQATHETEVPSTSTSEKSHEDEGTLPVQRAIVAEQRVEGARNGEHRYIQRNGFAPVGIGKKKTIKKYVEAVGKGLSGDTVPRQQFLDSTIKPAVIAALEKHKVPNAPIEIAPASRLSNPNNTAEYAHSEHNIKIADDPKVVPSTLSRDQAMNLAAMVYHEARHAEQWFSLARRIAFLQGITDPNELLKHIFLPGAILTKAVALGKEGDFDKKAKREWAAKMHAEIIGTGQSSNVSGATIGQPRNEWLEAQSAPGEVQKKGAALVDQINVLAKADESTYPKDAKTVPLPTDFWSTPGAQKVAAVWQPCLNALQTHGPDMLGKPFNAATPQEKIDLFNILPSIVPTTKGVLKTYLDTYRTELVSEAKSWDSQAEMKKAHARYKSLADESEAWAIQEHVLSKLKELKR
jgi:hypothetical protein